MIYIAKVYAISADVMTGCANEIGGVRVVLVHDGESSARKCTLKWFVGV